MRFLKYFYASFLGAFLILPASGPALARTQSAPRVNVFIIVIDALRKDHVGVYGYGRNTTPNIDRFARAATVFTNAVSECSWTHPAVASLFTSLPPSVHGVSSYHMDKTGVKTDILNPKLLTLAEAMKENGYHTGAFVANHWISERNAFHQGFDVFDPVAPEFKPPAEKVTKKALKWITENREEPIFAYLHYFDPHGPYQPPPPYDQAFTTRPPRPFIEKGAHTIDTLSGGYLSAGREKDRGNLSYYLDLYDGAILYADAQIGLLLDGLRKLDLYDNSLVVIVSDHGEAFFEHSTFDHGFTVYSEEINIPLIVKFPPPSPPRGGNGTAVSLADIGPTVLAAAGVRYHSFGAGRNLAELIKAEEQENKELFSEELSPFMKGPAKVSLIEGKMKAIYRHASGTVEELYDLEKDPGEKKNLLKKQPGIAAQMEKKIERRLKAGEDEREKRGLDRASTIIKDSERIEQLKSLGYIN